jgi:hypothetical protein
MTGAPADDGVGEAPPPIVDAERIAGVTPHQYVMRTFASRGNAAACRAGQSARPGARLRVGDVSNFNRAFRTESGMSRRAFREHHAGNMSERS